MSKGLPVVMSRFTHDCFGDVPSCVGEDPQSMKLCVIDTYQKKDKWMKLQKEGLNFISKTHDRNPTMMKWSDIISQSFALAKKRRIVFKVAEKAYGQTYQLKFGQQNMSAFKSFLEHFVLQGREEGKIYADSKEIWSGLTKDQTQQEKQCDAGERNYMRSYPDVAENWKGLAFDHYIENGKSEGRTYACEEKCDEGERIYMKMYSDLIGNWNDSAFSHFLRFGKGEGRVYLCKNN